MLKNTIALILVSLFTSNSFAACNTPTADELRDFFVHSEWIEVDENNEIVTYKTIKMAINFDEPKKSTLQVGKKSHTVSKICKKSYGFKVHSGALASVKVSKEGEHLYGKLFGTVYSLLPISSDLLQEVSFSESQQPHLNERRIKDRVFHRFLDEGYESDNTFEIEPFDISNEPRSIDI